jgi:hypothetical protein
MKELIEKYRVAIVLIIILILTVGGIVTLYYFNNKKISEQVIIWNGPGGEYKIDIVNKNGFKTYTTYVDIRGQRYGYPLRHSPYDVENISIQNNILPILLSKQGIYITRDSDLGTKTNQSASISSMEFGEILGSGQFGIYKKGVKSAFTNQTKESIDYKIPTITCSNITKNIGVIYMKLSKENKIYINNECIILEATDGDNLIKVGEKLAYKLLGVF